MTNIKFFSVIISLLAVLSYDNAYGITMHRSPKDTEIIKIFSYSTDVKGYNAVVVGKITAFSVRDDTATSQELSNAMDKTKATVRLYDREGIRQGDTLYVIDENHLIVSKITVKSIFNSISLGPISICYGNCRLSKIGNRVVQKIDQHYSKYAYIHKARGDYFKNTGDNAQAIVQYKKALSLDSGNPEAHLYLGILYLEDNLIQFALNEFKVSLKNLGRMYDKEDRYLLFENMAEAYFRGAYKTILPENKRHKFIRKGILVCNEGLKLFPGSRKLNYYAGVFYYNNPEPSDVKAKHFMLKCIELNPDNVNAYVILSELYYKHKNREKSLYYANRALKIDPMNERAKYIIKLIE